MNRQDVVAEMTALGPEAFQLPGGPVALLLIHGLTGSPREMRLLGDYMAERGFAVSAPLLPGHGTMPGDLQDVSWEDWYLRVETTYREMTCSHSSVFVVGFSLGALLAAHLAAEHPVAGLAALSPGLLVRDWRAPFARYLKLIIRSVPKDLDPDHSDLADKSVYPVFWQYPCWPSESVYQLGRLQQVVRKELGRIKAPAFVAYSTNDASIHPQSGHTLLRELGSTDKTELVLHKSGHGIVVDAERSLLFERLSGWISTHAASMEDD